MLAAISILNLLSQLTSVSAPPSTGGGLITIQGTNFYNLSSIITVYFGTDTCAIASASLTQVRSVFVLPFLFSRF